MIYDPRAISSAISTLWSYVGCIYMSLPHTHSSLCDRNHGPGMTLWLSTMVLSHILDSFSLPQSSPFNPHLLILAPLLRCLSLLISSLSLRSSFLPPPSSLTHFSPPPFPHHHPPSHPSSPPTHTPTYPQRTRVILERCLGRTAVILLQAVCRMLCVRLAEPSICTTVSPHPQGRGMYRSPYYFTSLF